MSLVGDRSLAIVDEMLTEIVIRTITTIGREGHAVGSPSARRQHPGTTSSDAQRIAELERENRELRRANEIVKVAPAFLARELSLKPPLVDFIGAHRDRFGVEPILCTVL